MAVCRVNFAAHSTISFMDGRVETEETSCVELNFTSDEFFISIGSVEENESSVEVEAGLSYEDLTVLKGAIELALTTWKYNK